jgi:hypothetical protein
VVGRAVTVYVEFTEPDATAPPVGASLDHMYMAVAKGGCTGGTVFTDHLVYEDSGASLANIFDTEAIDGGGQLYILLGGQLKDGEQGTNLYLFTSTDGGEHWTHTRVNPPTLQANVLPALAGGKAKGEALLGWFGSTATDPNDTKAVWNYYAAATYDGGQTFNSVRVGDGPVHYGDICTQGIFCGLIPGQPSNRNLADFSSAAVDPANGCGALAVPADPYNRPDLPDGTDNGDSSAFVSLQQDSSTCFTEANSGAAAVQVGAAGPGLSGAGTVGGGCLDRSAPNPKVAKAGASALRGSTADRGCGSGGSGHVTRVSVSIARVTSGGRCRLASSSGKLGRTQSCSHRRYLRAHGTSHWSVRLRHRLPRGRYVAVIRARDAAGNQRTRSVRFSVR